MIDLYYTQTNDRHLDEVANAVSAHLNYLGTERTEVPLEDVRQITVEGASQYYIPRIISGEFSLLRAADASAATTFRKKLMQHRILSSVLSAVYDKVKDRMQVVAEVDVPKLADARIFTVGAILGNLDFYLRISRQFYGDRYFLEKRIKDVFEQVAVPRLDDLSVTQARMITLQAAIEADLRQGFAGIDGKFANAETKSEAMRSDFERMHAELLAAIKNPKNA